MGPEANTKFMQPIAPDTILQQRYRLMSLIGEGGFGRTYLATDQSRFGEQCAIKELSVASHSRSRLSKAREFFKQEAALLYQLQHPQIPRFWATFEERDRMFLVQDYVPGRTYESLLQERAEKHQTFTEAEVWRFLLQVLPVLGYIHSQGVVHQDISPDNIILRETDLLPVLIDFGVVKQLANRLQGEQTGLAAVHVGKAGYAPMEQINSGYAYPNSDLYSLAVTAVVLLTGRPATDHFNAGHINWAWRNWVNVSDGLANVLGKMITYEPTDRYQSAVEVFQALQSLSLPADRVEQTKPLSVSQIHPAAGQRSVSVPIAETDRSPARKVLDVVTNFDVTSVWERPQVFIPLFLVVALLSFGTGLTLMSFFNKPETTAQPSPSPSPSNSNQPLVGSKDGSGKGNKSIDLEAGQTSVQSGRLLADREENYEFYGTQGQELTIEIDNKNLLITVLGSNGLPVDSQAIRTPTWRGQILATGKHTVQIKQLPGAKGEAFDYRLLATLALRPSAPKVGKSETQPSVSTTNNPSPVTNPAGVIPKPAPVVTPAVIPSGEITNGGNNNRNTGRGSSGFSSQPETAETPESKTSPSFMPEVTPSSESSQPSSSSPEASPSNSPSNTPTPTETLLSPR
jgi:serine/threonine protein kinase